MIHDLDQTLENLIQSKILSPQGLQDQVAISFAPPDDQFQASLGTNLTINLFLYEITENLELRTQEWHYERQPGESSNQIRVSPPTRVDCSYLITVWSSSSESQVRDEHQMLGLLMQDLCRYSYLPKDILSGSLELAEIRQGSVSSNSSDAAFSHIPARALQVGKLQSVAEFWQAIGGRPKASINYTVTLSVTTGEDSEPVGVVEPDKLVWNFHQKRPGESRQSTNSEASVNVST